MNLIRTQVDEPPGQIPHRGLRPGFHPVTGGSPETSLVTGDHPVPGNERRDLLIPEGVIPSGSGTKNNGHSTSTDLVEDDLVIGSHETRGSIAGDICLPVRKPP